MSSGDGGNIFESFSGGGNFFENLLTDVANIGVQSATFGVYGVGKNGLKNGVTTNTVRTGGRAAEFGVKEITGANAAEQANALAREQFELQKEQSQAERAEAYRQVGIDQVKQSMLAGAARNTSRGASNKGSFSLGGDEKDFLGI